LERAIPPEFRPFMRESALARMSLAEGLANLRKAHHMDAGYYHQAFFGLSIGLERLLKLIVLIDHALTHDGALPATQEFKTAYGHDLTRLFAQAIVIRERLDDEGETLRWGVPDMEITNRILAVLTEFARVTRYYNLDVLTGADPDAGRDPIAAWAVEVGRVLEDRQSPARRQRDERDAATMQRLIGDRTVLLQETETGGALHRVDEAVLHGRRTEFVQREATFHTATIVRYLVETLWQLCDRCRPGAPVEVPELWERFEVFYNGDAYLRRRKTFLS